MCARMYGHVPLGVPGGSLINRNRFSRAKSSLRNIGLGSIMFRLAIVAFLVAVFVDHVINDDRYGNAVVDAVSHMIGEYR